MGSSSMVLLAILAAPSAPSDEAIKADTAGKVHYVAGRNAEAAEEFLKAWQATPVPKYLFNRAKALQGLPDPHARSRAYIAYLGYLHALPAAEDRADVEGRLVEMVAERPEGLAVVRFTSERPIESLLVSIEPAVPIPGGTATLLLPLGTSFLRVRRSSGEQVVEVVASGTMETLSLDESPGGGLAVDGRGGAGPGDVPTAPAAPGTSEGPAWSSLAIGGALVAAAAAVYLFRPAGGCPSDYDRAHGLAGEACYRDAGAEGVMTTPMGSPTRLPEAALGILGLASAGAGLLGWSFF